jgi:hypothetical protein
MDKVYVLILPTKIERNMWFYSMKNMQKDLYQDKDEDFKRVNVEYFSLEAMKSEALPISANIPIINKKNLESLVPLLYNLRRINKSILTNSNSYYEQSVRPVMDFTELKRLQDEETQIENDLLNGPNVPEEEIFGFDDLEKENEKEETDSKKISKEEGQPNTHKVEAGSFDLKDEFSLNFNGSSI